MKTTPEAIRLARSAAGMTQAEAARLVHISGSDPGRTWRGWEAGRPPNEAAIHLFCLLTGQEYPPTGEIAEEEDR